MSSFVPTELDVFPTCPTYGFTVQPQYYAHIAGRLDGFERVDRRWSRCLNVYTAVPTGNRDEADIQAILYFWHACGGRRSTFLLKDYVDYKSCQTQQTPAVTDQIFRAVSLTGGGTGYQMVKRYTVGAFHQDREITQPDGDTIVVANAAHAVQDGWTLDERNGLLVPDETFSGVPTSWGGEFYVPVRFDSELSLQIVDKQVQSVDFTLTEKRMRLETSIGSP